MPLLTSKYRSGLDNLSVDIAKIQKIQLGKPNPANPRLWVIYFWGVDEKKQEKVIRTWFYQSERDREAELNRIREKYPHLEIE